MFNHAIEQALYTYLGYGILINMQSFRLDDNRTCIIVMNHHALLDKLKLTEEQLIGTVSNKRTHNKAIKLLENNNDLALYGIGQTLEMAKSVIVTKIKQELKLRGIELC